MHFFDGPHLASSSEETYLSPTEKPLVRSGILQLVRSHAYASTLVFAAPMAKQFFFRKTFPESSRENTPDVLQQKGIDWLIEETLKHVDSRRLAQTAKDEKQFPKEAAFQHEFYPAMAKLLHPSIVLVPEKCTPSHGPPGAHECVCMFSAFAAGADYGALLSWGWLQSIRIFFWYMYRGYCCYLGRVFRGA